MSHCSLGLSCDPICDHGIHTSRQRCIHCELQRQITALTDMYKELSIRVVGFHDHKLRQIDENRKISKRVDELDAAYKVDFEVAKDIIFESARTHASILKCEKGLKDLEQLFYDEKAKFRCNDKKPYKCPLCDGKGGFYISGTMDSVCYLCESKGIVWG